MENNNKVKILTANLEKVSVFKKLNLMSKLNFRNVKMKLASSIKNIRKENKTANMAWKIVELSRKEERPKTKDYIELMLDDFIPLSGDRLFGEDKSILAGFGKIQDKSVAVIGHNKGKNLKERVEYNFGMPNPQGYRKAMRIMSVAERLNIPLITIIDTPGANPAIEAEDLGQASAIANSIEYMFKLKIPVIVIFIGEGGSGGALALAIGNYIIMLENSTYSVISPEGCAAILWKDQNATKKAAATLRLTAKDLAELKVVDKIIREPFGGAQNSPERAAKILKKHILNKIEELSQISGEELVKLRYKKFESFGFYEYVE
ncbi:MAG TPA: acetyl-CoA carboxylase carboxyl transferase subunit alpha [Actinobacteria bacterium]|nr:acetyl-CoA carboxylase carboxyl transferase subunit alpha [Actinomycetota bacterium]